MKKILESNCFRTGLIIWVHKWTKEGRRKNSDSIWVKYDYWVPTILWVACLSRNICIRTEIATDLRGCKVNLMQREKNVWREMSIPNYTEDWGDIHTYHRRQGERSPMRCADWAMRYRWMYIAGLPCLDKYGNWIRRVILSELTSKNLTPVIVGGLVVAVIALIAQQLFN